MKVGFVGLGMLGAPIARRIARSGFSLVAYDISPQALAAFDEPGTVREVNPITAASQVDVLCVCVRTDQDLKSLVGDGTLFAALGQGGLFIIHSTVAPALCRQLADTAKTYASTWWTPVFPAAALPRLRENVRFSPVATRQRSIGPGRCSPPTASRSYT